MDQQRRAGYAEAFFLTDCGVRAGAGVQEKQRGRDCQLAGAGRASQVRGRNQRGVRTVLRSQRVLLSGDSVCQLRLERPSDDGHGHSLDDREANERDRFQWEKSGCALPRGKGEDGTSRVLLHDVPVLTECARLHKDFPEQKKRLLERQETHRKRFSLSAVSLWTGTGLLSRTIPWTDFD